MRLAVCMPQVPFERGGTEIFADGLVQALREHGHETELVTVPFKWYPGERVLTQAFLWRLLDLEEANGRPVDAVIATGELHSVRELTETAFVHVGLDWAEHVRVDDALKRGQAELHHLVGDAAKARAELGWRPTVGFEELVRLLVDAALARLTTS